MKLLHINLIGVYNLGFQLNRKKKMEGKGGKRIQYERLVDTLIRFLFFVSVRLYNEV